LTSESAVYTARITTTQSFFLTVFTDFFVSVSKKIFSTTRWTHWLVTKLTTPLDEQTFFANDTKLWIVLTNYLSVANFKLEIHFLFFSRTKKKSLGLASRPNILFGFGFISPSFIYYYHINFL
jgi:hypothetical protein